MTVMWEAKAADGHADELLAHVLAHIPDGAQVYRSSDRVVVIDPTGHGVPEPPAGVVARPSHVWEFERIR